VGTAYEKYVCMHQIFYMRVTTAMQEAEDLTLTRSLTRTSTEFNSAECHPQAQAHIDKR